MSPLTRDPCPNNLFLQVWEGAPREAPTSLLQPMISLEILAQSPAWPTPLLVLCAPRILFSEACLTLQEGSLPPSAISAYLDLQHLQSSPPDSPRYCHPSGLAINRDPITALIPPTGLSCILGTSTPAGLTEQLATYLEPVHFSTANVVVHSAPKDVHGIRDDSGCMEEPPTGQLRRTRRQSNGMGQMPTVDLAVAKIVSQIHVAMKEERPKIPVPWIEVPWVLL